MEIFYALLFVTLIFVPYFIVVCVVFWPMLAALIDWILFGTNPTHDRIQK